MTSEFFKMPEAIMEVSNAIDENFVLDYNPLPKQNIKRFLNITKVLDQPLTEREQYRVCIAILNTVFTKHKENYEDYSLHNFLFNDSGELFCEKQQIQLPKGNKTPLQWLQDELKFLNDFKIPGRIENLLKSDNNIEEQIKLLYDKESTAIKNLFQEEQLRYKSYFQQQVGLKRDKINYAEQDSQIKDILQEQDIKNNDVKIARQYLQWFKQKRMTPNDLLVLEKMIDKLTKNKNQEEIDKFLKLYFKFFSSNVIFSSQSGFEGKYFQVSKEGMIIVNSKINFKEKLEGQTTEINVRSFRAEKMYRPYYNFQYAINRNNYLSYKMRAVNNDYFYKIMESFLNMSFFDIKYLEQDELILRSHGYQSIFMKRDGEHKIEVKKEDIKNRNGCNVTFIGNGDDFPKQGPDDILEINQLKNGIYKLVIHDYYFEEEVAEEFIRRTLSSLKSLKTLHFSNCYLDSQFFRYKSVFEGLSGLKSITFENIDSNITVGKELVNILEPLNKLEEISLGAISISDSLQQELLQKGELLKRLYLANCQINENKFDFGKQFKFITHLSLSNTNLTQLIEKQKFTLPKGLIMLDLSKNKLFDKDLALIFEVNNIDNLRELYLRENKLRLLAGVENENQGFLYKFMLKLKKKLGTLKDFSLDISQNRQELSSSKYFLKLGFKKIDFSLQKQSFKQTNHWNQAQVAQNRQSSHQQYSQYEETKENPSSSENQIQEMVTSKEQQTQQDQLSNRVQQYEQDYGDEEIKSSDIYNQPSNNEQKIQKEGIQFDSYHGILNQNYHQVQDFIDCLYAGVDFEESLLQVKDFIAMIKAYIYLQSRTNRFAIYQHQYPNTNWALPDNSWTQLLDSVQPIPIYFEDDTISEGLLDLNLEEINPSEEITNPIQLIQHISTLLGQQQRSNFGNSAIFTYLIPSNEVASDFYPAILRLESQNRNQQLQVGNIDSTSQYIRLVTVLSNDWCEEQEKRVNRLSLASYDEMIYILNLLNEKFGFEEDFSDILGGDIKFSIEGESINDREAVVSMNWEYFPGDELLIPGIIQGIDRLLIFLKLFIQLDIYDSDIRDPNLKKMVDQLYEDYQRALQKNLPSCDKFL